MKIGHWVSIRVRSVIVLLQRDSNNLYDFRIALMVCDYHDFCRCCSGELTGATILQHRLLSGLGYAVLPIPHTEYGPKDVLMDRVRYINEKIKTVFTET